MSYAVIVFFCDGALLALFDVMTVQEAQRAREEGEKRRRERGSRYRDKRRRRRVNFFLLRRICQTPIHLELHSNIKPFQIIIGANMSVSCLCQLI